MNSTLKFERRTPRCDIGAFLVLFYIRNDKFQKPILKVNKPTFTIRNRNYLTMEINQG